MLEPGLDGGDHLGGIGASEYIFAAVFEPDKEAVGRFAVAGYVAAYARLCEYAIVAEETAATYQAFLRHSGAAQLDPGNPGNRNRERAQQRAYRQLSVIYRHRYWSIEKSRQA